MGTIVLPINVVTGLWGMNCLVPGQDYEGLAWFWGIVGCMALFSLVATLCEKSNRFITVWDRKRKKKMKAE